MNDIKKDVVLEDRVLPIHFVIHPRATRLTLRIEADGRAVRVTAPAGVNPKEVNRFIDRHQGWIAVRAAKLPHAKLAPMIRPGIKIPIFGISHRLVHHHGRGTTEISSEPEPQIIVYGDEAYLARRTADFLKKQAEAYMIPLVIGYAAKLDVKPKSIRFKDTKSRWGSCSSNGNLNFSWRIGMAPKPVVQYLVAHEVSHLREMNHSHRFWSICEQLCGEVKSKRAWLKRNGPMLQAVDFQQGR